MNQYIQYNGRGIPPIVTPTEARIVLDNVRDTRWMNATDKKEYLQKIKPRILRMINDGKAWEEIDEFFLLQPGDAKAFINHKKKKSNKARKAEIEAKYPKIKRLLRDRASHSEICRQLKISKTTLQRHLPYITAEL